MIDLQDYPAIARSIADTIAKGSTKLTSAQYLCMVGAMAVWFEKMKEPPPDLQAYVRGLEADAARYRFLRESGETGGVGVNKQRGITIANNERVLVHFIYWTDRIGFDTAIDTAIAATAKGG